MISEWTPAASADVSRLCDFIAQRAPEAAERLAAELAGAPRRLVRFPRMGARLPTFDPREVRRLIVGRYELRYEVLANTIRILRVFHEREHRAPDAE